MKQEEEVRLTARPETLLRFLAGTTRLLSQTPSLPVERLTQKHTHTHTCLHSRHRQTHTHRRAASIVKIRFLSGIRFNIDFNQKLLFDQISERIRRCFSQN